MRKRKSGKACKAEAVQLVFAERSAEFKPASDIFVVTGTFGSDCGISQLADLMRSYGILFYKSPTRADNRGPSGLIARDDTIILKVNSQWDEAHMNVYVAHVAPSY